MGTRGPASVLLLGTICALISSVVLYWLSLAFIFLFPSRTLERVSAKYDLLGHWPLGRDYMQTFLSLLVRSYISNIVSFIYVINLTFPVQIQKLRYWVNNYSQQSNSLNKNTPEFLRSFYGRFFFLSKQQFLIYWFFLKRINWKVYKFTSTNICSRLW